jgi:hypothetical protein
MVADHTTGFVFLKNSADFRNIGIPARRPEPAQAGSLFPSLQTVLRQKECV